MIYATYCPEDDKLRLYSSRVPRETYDALRAAGFAATPKQNCSFAAVWTPRREDIVLSLIEGDIEDEDTDPAERAADRAERFSGYRERRLDEAHAEAAACEALPDAIGAASEQRADRLARRVARSRARAVSQWSRAEYWTWRTEGVIANAMHRCDPDVRRGRMAKLARAVARTSPDSRWGQHFRLRLAYETQMVDAAGGAASTAGIAVGGFMQWDRETWVRVRRVWKSPLTGAVVSVEVEKPSGGRCRRNIERLASGVYRAPAAADLEALAAIEAAEAAAKRVAAKTRLPAPPLINPPDEDAEALQAILDRVYGERGGVWKMTQWEYGQRSKGRNGVAGTGFITELKRLYRSAWWGPCDGRVKCFKIRYGMGRVIVLTDKPRKPAPWRMCEDAAAAQPRREDLIARIDEVAEAIGAGWRGNPAQKALAADACYVGLVKHGNGSHCYGWTDIGLAAVRSRQVALEGVR